MPKRSGRHEKTVLNGMVTPSRYGDLLSQKCRVRRQLVRMNSELEQEIAPMTEEDRNKLTTIVGKDAPLTEDGMYQS